MGQPISNLFNQGQNPYNFNQFSQPQNQSMQPNQPSQPLQPNQLGNFTQPHRPTSMMDLLDQFNTFKNEYMQQYGNTDPKVFANQVLQSGQVPQGDLNKIGQVANVIRNLMPRF